MDESAEPHLDSTTQPTFTRREALAIAAAALLPVQVRPPAPKKIIVAGAGIGGLSCAWELVRRGHDVTVIEASGRTGGHVMTFRDGLDDALYADAGAEHFTQPGYERYWGYVREFNLAHVYYPRREHLLRWIGGQMYTPEMLADRKVLETLGLNRREADYLGQHPFPELASLYFAPYVDSFTDEYRPFDAGLNELDKVSTDGTLSQGRGVGRGARLYRRQWVGVAGGVACRDPETARRSALSATGVSTGGWESDAHRHVCSTSRRARSAALSGHGDRARRDRRAGQLS